MAKPRRVSGRAGLGLVCLIGLAWNAEPAGAGAGLVGVIGEGGRAEATPSVARAGARTRAPAEVRFKPCGRWPAEVRGKVACVRVVGNLAYAVVQGFGLVVYEIGPTGALSQKGGCAIGGTGRTVGIEGRWACVGLAEEGLVGVDVTDPDHPKLRGHFPPDAGPDHADDAWFSCLDVVGPRVYAGGSDGTLRVLDVSQPSAPKCLGVAHATGGVQSLQADGNRVYVTDSEGLKAFDVTDPAVPLLVGRYPIKSSSLKLRVQGGRVFVAAWKELIILQVEP